MGKEDGNMLSKCMNIHLCVDWDTCTCSTRCNLALINNHLRKNTWCPSNVYVTKFIYRENLLECGFLWSKLIRGVNKSSWVKVWTRLKLSWASLAKFELVLKRKNISSISNKFNSELLKQWLDQINYSELLELGLTMSVNLMYKFQAVLISHIS